VKIIRVFPRYTSFTPIDDYAFVGDPPLIRPKADEVHVSVTFTWDKKEAERLKLAWGQYYPVVKIGGPAYSSPCYDFIPGRYISYGITFTSRGCNNRCGYCEAWKREGKLCEIEDFAPGLIVQDNNLLQCSIGHIGRVMAMLKKQNLVTFSGGFEARLLTDNINSYLKDLDIYQLFLSCDTDRDFIPLEKALKKLEWRGRDKYGLLKGIRCYVLLAYDGETMEQGIRRLERVYEAGALPFAQLYQPVDKWINYSKEWRDLARTWSRPAATKSLMELMK